jgi:hypothetical protein
MKYLYLLSLLVLFACGGDDDLTPATGNSNNEWLIPPSQVFDGGPGKDGIPSVDDPEFNNTDDPQFLIPGALVVGIVDNGIAKAYPHIILDWHEIVNDNIGDNNFAITYCPLTGTAVGWDRQVGNRTTTFGVSGKLYNTNLMPFDRETDSYWSQLRLDCVNGSLVGEKINTVPVVETTWSTWRTCYPNSLLMNTNTGFSRNYGQYPYGDYKTNNDNIIFPVDNLDSRLPAKERVLTVITEDASKVYSIETFDEFKVIEDQVGRENIVVIGSKQQNFMVAYKTGDLSGFQPVVGELPVIAQDGSGQKITLTGEIITGPQAGQQLESTESIIGYYFAMAAFYPEVEIYEE